MQNNPIQRTKIWLLGIALLLPSLWAPATMLANDPQTEPAKSLDQQIAGLIEQLGDSNFRVRSSAQQALDKIGLPAYEQLRKALDHSDIQIARTAEYLLRSQNVVWWLDTDSYEVRVRLMDYSSLDSNGRQTRLLELANLATDDALLALCRVAKFENNELCSRSSSLALLRALTKLDSSRRMVVSHSIVLTIGTANRTSTRWLEAYCNQSLSGQPIDLDLWKQFADELSQELKRSSKSGNSLRSASQQVVQQQKQQVLQFYEWLVGWLCQERPREEALTVARKSLDLATDNLHAVHEFCTWALSVDLPELVVEIFQQRDLRDGQTDQQGNKALALLEKDHQQLHYLLAEAHRKLGDEEKARQTAEVALEVPAKKMAVLQIARSNANEILAIQRVNQARALSERGHFDWAEAELLAAVQLQTRTDSSVRLELAEHYREGKQFSRAVETLQPIINNPPVDKNLPLADDFSYLLASYHWYKALQAEQDGQREEAVQNLTEACQANEESHSANPDIIIALHRVASSPEEKAVFRKYFNRLVDKYRAEVADAEASLSQALGALNSPQRLAESCNQLAWLLACCETNVEEAIYLSQRSLEFDAEVHTYLDTMARCLFAAGRIEEAIEFQQRAVAGQPHSRSMKAQLREFQKALSEKR